MIFADDLYRILTPYPAEGMETTRSVTTID